MLQLEEKGSHTHTHDLDSLDTENLKEVKGHFQDYIPHQWRRHYGNNYIFMMIKGEPLITLGPHWYMNVCMFVTFFVISFMLITYVALHRNLYILICSVSVEALQIISYSLCSLINPGIVSAKSEPIDKDMLACDVCFTTSQEESTYHCEDCNVCVDGYDHHCPWTGKCIGKRNLSYFYFFVIMIPINIVYMITIVVTG